MSIEYKNISLKFQCFFCQIPIGGIAQKQALPALIAISTTSISSLQQPQKKIQHCLKLTFPGLLKFLLFAKLAEPFCCDIC